MAEMALDRDLRRLRRALAAFFVFLLLLPWLALQAQVSFPDLPWGRAPVRLPQPEPVPVTYPVAVQWVPLPLPVLAEWIQRRYPGSLIGPEELQVIHDVARRWNVNTAILLGILAAEHSFLSPAVVGWRHALKFYENPFSYGVYPGSPFPLAIGLEASADGAARIVSRVIRSMPEGAWSEADFAEFYRRLSGFYVLGDAAQAVPHWLRNVVLTQRALMEEARAHLVEWAAAFAAQADAGWLRRFAARTLEDIRARAMEGLETVAGHAAAVARWLQEAVPPAAPVLAALVTMLALMQRAALAAVAVP